jgi:hypothetical protein
MKDDGAVRQLQVDAQVTPLNPGGTVHTLKHPTRRLAPNAGGGDANADEAEARGDEALTHFSAPAPAPPAATKPVHQPRGRRVSPKMTIDRKRGKFNLGFKSEGDLELLIDAFGSPDGDFALGMLGRLVEATGGGDNLSERELNEFLATIAGIGPNDEIEAMLAIQIVLTNHAAVGALGRLMRSNEIPQQDSNGNIAIKFLRTNSSLIDQLQRYRGKGQQDVKVEHVHVNEGAQAIVGNINSHGGT